jgi:outer membrane protein TolC
VQEPDPTPEAPFPIEATYQEALKLIKESRWTEAKRAIELVEAVDPTYKNAAKLRVMVEEVIQTSFYGFRLPPHLAAQQRQAAAPPASADEPEDEPSSTPSRRTRWPLILAGAIVLVMLVAIWMMFPR